MTIKRWNALLFFFIISIGWRISAQAVDLSVGDAQILHDYLMLFDPGALGETASLRTAARGAEPDMFPDATNVVLRVVRRWNTLEPQTQAALQPYFDLVPVTGRTGEREAAQSSSSCAVSIADSAATRQSQHFTIHYTTAAGSAHAVSSAGSAGTPTYISNILLYAEIVYEKEIETLGFQPPPMAADGRYHIYICDIVSRGYLGLTVTNAYYANNSAGSYLELDNDYTEPNILRAGQTVKDMLEVTMAHEFFHAIQFGLNWRYPSYWALESTAVWMEDFVYPNNNDYIAQYLINWFANTTTSIDHFSSGNTLAYGSSIFWHYISQKVSGNSMIYDVWSLFKNDTQDCNVTGCPAGSYEITEIPLIEQYLVTKGTDLDTVFKNFGAANYSRDYVDAAQSNFPTVAPVDFGQAYATLNTGSQALNHLATKYFKFIPATTQYDLRFTIAFTGNASVDWGMQAVFTTANGTRLVKTATVSSGAASLFVDGFGTTYTQAVIIVSNLSTASTADGKTYSLAMTQADVPYNTVTSSRTLSAGWNLIAVPVYSQFPNPTQAITIDAGGDTLTAAETFYYNNSAGVMYDASHVGSGYLGLGAPGAGYWMFMQNNSTISLSGLDPSVLVVDVPVGPGWNMIGCPYTTAMAWGDSKIMVLQSGSSVAIPLSQAVSRGWLSGVLYDWTGSAYNLRAHNSSFSMQPWTGYWLEVKKDLIIRIYK
jgi:hypothetical protein